MYLFTLCDISGSIIPFCFFLLHFFVNHIEFWIYQARFISAIVYCIILVQLYFCLISLFLSNLTKHFERLFLHNF